MTRVYTRKTALEKLEQYLEPGEPNDCWEWPGTRNQQGYGIIDERGKKYRASRLMYERHKGPIPDGLLVCHTCDNPPCCNPLHLFLGTHKDNMQDAVRKGRLCTGERAKLRDRCRGEDHGMARLTESDVRAIRAARSAGHTVTGIARDWGISLGAASLIVNRKRWAHVS